MPVADLVERGSALKRELLEFARRPKFTRPLGRMLAEAGHDDLDEGRLITALDTFILQHRLSDGRTVVDHFIDAHPELADSDRDLMLGWRDVIEGVFEVKGRDGAAIILLNLIDELTYRVRSNTGTAVFRQLPRRSFVVARLVPLGDEWLLSGRQLGLPAAASACSPKRSTNRNG